MEIWHLRKNLQLKQLPGKLTAGNGDCFYKKEKEEGSVPSSRFRSFPALVSLGRQNLTAVVVAASLASSMRHDGLTTLGANGYAGSRQLPVGTPALIATSLGHFTLRDSHG